MINPRGIFVTTNGDVYVDSGTQGRIDKWSPAAIDSVVVMHFNFSCFALFLDPNNTMYCAMPLRNQIGKQASPNDLYAVAVAAGTGTNGTAADMLSNPCGIFVDAGFTLFVADTDNHRIQRFLYGQSSGITLAGAGALGTITLNRPHAIVLDGDGYLFIVELGSHRITASGPQGFSCVAACTGTSGLAPDQLFSPVTIALDSHGSIFVMDRDNARIQQFVLATNTCSE